MTGADEGPATPCVLLMSPDAALPDALRAGGFSGWMIEVAAGLADALSRMTSNAASAIVVDARAGDPAAALLRLREEGADVPIVVAGVADDAEAVAQLLEAGADETVVDGPDGRTVAEALGRATVRRARENALRDAARRAGHTLDSIVDGLVTADASGRVEFVNLAARDLSGWSAQAAVGRPLWEVIRIIDTAPSARGGPIAGTAVDRIVEIGGSHTLVRRDGTHVPVEGTLSPVRNSNGVPVGSVLVFRDVSVDRALAQQMAHSAQHDHLTGLPNRLLLADRIGSAISIAPRHDKKVAVLFLDLDGFKQINDTLGHLVGDELLQSVARRLLSCVRASDTVSRQGGDEFVVLLSEVERPEDAAITARRMIEAISRTHTLERHEVRVTTSIGIAVYPDDGTTPEGLIRNADTAMYQAKEGGRHGYRFYKPAMNLRAIERQDVEESLRRALEREEFVLHFQPKVNLRTGEISGAEALLRWTHPTRGEVSPEVFVPVAEASGLMQPIGSWVLREACRQAQEWQRRGLGLPRVAVNVSTVQFQASSFLADVFDALNDTGFDPRLLEIEINEGVLVRHADSAGSILEALRAAGVELSIDDFGTGYSSLSHLRRYPIQGVKIDRSFVRDIGANADTSNVVTAVLTMAQSLNLRVVAEGVETPEELEFLQYHKCDEAQGFYFSHPLPAKQFTRLLQDGLLPTMAARHYRGPLELRTRGAA